MKHLWIKQIGSQLWMLLLLGWVVWGSMGGVRGSIWVTLALLYVLLIPGYRISWYFFRIGELGRGERGTVSVAISLLLVVFGWIYAYLLGWEIVTIELLGICRLVSMCSFIGLMWKKLYLQDNSVTDH